MNFFQRLLDRSYHNSGGEPVEDLQMLDDENVDEYLELPAQTPPLIITTPPQHRCRQRRSNRASADSNMIDDPIPRPAIDINNHSGKMLALPIPSVRPVDINTRREPGCMGINPITLMGETGLLPGSWGDGMEFVNPMAWHQPRRQPQKPEPVTPRADAEKWQHSQQKPCPAVIDFDELQLQYAQAILDGHVFEDSSVEGTLLQVTMQSRAESLPSEYCEGGDEEKEEHDDEADWVNISDEENAVDGQKASNHKREDSGYSSGEAYSTRKTARVRVPVVPRRKKVRFDDEAIEKEQREWRVFKSTKV